MIDTDVLKRGLMGTNYRKQLLLQEVAMLPGSGSRKAAGAELGFLETTHTTLAD